LPREHERVYLCLLSLQEVLKDKDQWTLKEGVWQSYGFQKEFFQTEIVPTIKKRMEGVYLVKGGNTQEHKVKVNASKPTSSRPSTTLIL